MLSTVTFQAVPAFRLHAVEQPERVDDVLERWDDEITGNDHFEFFWIPNTGWALTKRNRRTDEPLAPRTRWRSFRDDYLLTNLGFDLTCRAGRLDPRLGRRMAKLVPGTGRAEYTDPSYKVFASARLVKFYEMEYAIPTSTWSRRSTASATWCVARGCRSVPGGGAGGGRRRHPAQHGVRPPTAYIAVHVYQGTAYDQYFQGVEGIMDDYGGRPHWGKMHFQTAATLAPRYPRWDEFQAVRARLDPDGRFTTRTSTGSSAPCRPAAEVGSAW